MRSSSSSLRLFTDSPPPPQIFNEWHTNPHRSILASNCIDAGFKLRPTEEELKEMGPEFNKVRLLPFRSPSSPRLPSPPLQFFDEYFRNKPDKPVMFSSIVSGAYADHSLLPPGKYMTMFSCVLPFFSSLPFSHPDLPFSVVQLPRGPPTSSFSFSFTPDPSPPLLLSLFPLQYPASRGQIHIKSKNCHVKPFLFVDISLSSLRHRR